MAVVSFFEFMFCHTNVGPYVTRGCCDSCLVDNVLGKTRIVKKAKVFVSTLAFLRAGGFVVFIKDLLIVVFDYNSHVCSVAVADLEVVSKCLSLKQEIRAGNKMPPRKQVLRDNQSQEASLEPFLTFPQFQPTSSRRQHSV